MDCINDCLFYLFCCGICRSREYHKKADIRKKKNTKELTDIIPKNVSPISKYNDPKDINPNEMTDTIIVGPNLKIKDADNVLRNKGYKMGYISRI